uniref:Truncated MtrR n=1 Tax=Neisseria gonorrhoeae TaxID=485 RepID=A0A142BLV3_NEIGO|nr:truncated MtrR [Neisseria gonorrhoeae]
MRKTKTEALKTKEHLMLAAFGNLLPQRDCAHLAQRNRPSRRRNARRALLAFQK